MAEGNGYGKDEKLIFFRLDAQDEKLDSIERKVTHTDNEVTKLKAIAGERGAVRGAIFGTIATIIINIIIQFLQ